MRDSKLKVCRFTKNALFDAYTQHTERAQVEESNQRVRFLYRYLKRIKVKTLVIEEDYTDADYLDDYAKFYVRSDKNYERRCRRIHFFSSALTPTSLKAQLLRAGAPPERLQKAYCGFSVVRPLPDAVVGRTVLVTYHAKGSKGQRYYPATHAYSAHLMGAKFRIRSLAFQEQDTVLAACATVALWSALHQAAEIFHTPRPSPAQITHSATDASSQTRLFPSRGLNIGQMCAAIKSVGLEPEVVTCGANTPILSLIYGYLKAELPVVLFVAVEKRGFHAITINGYQISQERVRESEVESTGATPIGGVGLRITQLYGHDDQICPFARLTVMQVPHVPDAQIAGNSLQREQKDEPLIYFEGQWVSDTTKRRGKPVPLRIVPLHLVIPVYHKIRLTYLDISGFVMQLSKLLTRNAKVPPTDLEWDIRLQQSSAWKRDLRDGAADIAIKERMLAWQLPRFIWVATLRGADGVAIMEMIFDSTGIKRSFPVLEILYFHEETRQRAFTLAGLVSPEDFKANRRLFLFLQQQREACAKPPVVEVTSPPEASAAPILPDASQPSKVQRKTATRPAKVSGVKRAGQRTVK